MHFTRDAPRGRKGATGEVLTIAQARDSLGRLILCSSWDADHVGVGVNTALGRSGEIWEISAQQDRYISRKFGMIGMVPMAMRKSPIIWICGGSRTRDFVSFVKFHGSQVPASSRCHDAPSCSPKSSICPQVEPLDVDHSVSKKWSCPFIKTRHVFKYGNDDIWWCRSSLNPHFMNKATHSAQHEKTNDGCRFGSPKWSPSPGCGEYLLILSVWQKVPHGLICVVKSTCLLVKIGSHNVGKIHRFQKQRADTHSNASFQRTQDVATSSFLFQNTWLWINTYRYHF